MQNTKTLYAVVGVDGILTEPSAVSRFVDLNCFMSLCHSLDVESDLTENFNTDCEANSGEELMVIAGVHNLLKSDAYLSQFSDRELIATGDENGIEQCREIIHTLARIFQATGTDASVRLILK